MKVLVDYRVLKFLDKLNVKDRVKAFEYIEIFEEFGFKLNERYFKKVTGSIWELRPGRVRLFVYVKSKNQVIIHAVHKKSQKISLKDLKLIKNRAKEYQ